MLIAIKLPKNVHQRSLESNMKRMALFLFVTILFGLSGIAFVGFMSEGDYDLNFDKA